MTGRAPPPQGEGATTVDTLHGGSLRLEQPARGRGYRFNADAPLLAREASLWPPVERAIDLGAGCGVVGLSLLALGAARRVLLVERDPWMASIAARNAAAWPGATVLAASVASLPATEPAPLVVSNPPYTPPDDGRPCPEPRRAEARRGEVAPFLRAAASLLLPGGLALFVYPAPALPALLRHAHDSGLHPARIRFVHPAPGAPARVALVAFSLAPLSLDIAPAHLG